MKLKGRTAFITGSSRGVGQQIALGLAQHGCDLVIHGRTHDACQSTLAMVKDLGATCHIVFGDLSTEANVLKVLQQIENLDLNIDILYNNAAIMTPYRDDYWTHSWDDWMQTMKVNVFAMYAICGALVPSMIKNNYGRVVNLISGIQNLPELAPYGASKWAVIKLTEDLASKTSNSGVRINSLEPGWLRTDMGSQNAPNPVTAVLPGALAPVFIENDGANGQIFRALDFA